MSKQNIDWSNLGFGYIKTIIATFAATRTVSGTKAGWKPTQTSP